MSASQTNEQALESSLEKALTGTCLEELKEKGSSPKAWEEDPASYKAEGQYHIGDANDFDARYAIDTRLFWSFLEKSQPEELEKLKRKSDYQLLVIDKLDKHIKKYGVLRLLKKGLEVENASFTLMYPLPSENSGETAKKNFKHNHFSVTRQVRYNLEKTGEEIDMVLFVNGIPYATMELKNQWTGQNARSHGIKQYKFQRDQTQPLLQYGRCLVHFAVDPDEVYMTTRLQGAATFFLPFNKGNNYGKGNPVNPFGHKTSYLWEEVLKPKSIAGIIQHFIRFDGSIKDPLKKRTLFFPRYHQLDVVRKLVADCHENGTGKTYLIQHSAGSGKSNSITWAAFQLIEVTPANDQLSGSKKPDEQLFDSVIVVTDRRLLDKQIRENIKEFSEVKNIVAPAHSSRELKEALESGKRIIITTIQKFPFIVDGVADLKNRNFAIIIDEAHSSQSGQTSDKMNRTIGATEDEEEKDAQDKIVEVMKTRKMSPNASYFAFTATPKNSTLEKFGVKKEDGKGSEAFHTYSMKQAIEEGFILDVLANYTTYKSYYKIHKSIEENPLFDTAKAQKQLKAFVEKHPDTIKVKSEIILDHFVKQVVNKKLLKNKAKGMIITQSIESAIRYYQAIQKHLEQRGKPFKVIVAFSGAKKVDGIEYTEDSINDLPSHLDRAKSSDPGYIQDKLARYFDMDEYRLLIVANKYLTGFDQPKLTSMYVDKKLQGLIAVQALSRLNRSSPKLGKRTEDLFVLDFFNSTDDIKKAFDDFYTSTSLSEATDINVLHELKMALDEEGVYEQSEVEAFVELYFNDADAQELSPIIDTAADRFTNELELSDEDKADYKIKAKQFVKIYGQMAAIMPYEMIEWEKLFWFLKFLIPKLPVIDKDKAKIDALLESVDLSTYGLERSRLNAKIGLDETETVVDPQNPNPRGAHGGGEEQDALDKIIQDFNVRWFQGWEATPEEQRIKFINLAERIREHPDYASKFDENVDTQNRELAFKKIFEEVMAKQRKQELDLYRLVSTDDSFKAAMQSTLKRILSA